MNCNTILPPVCSNCYGVPDIPKNAPRKQRRLYLLAIRKAEKKAKK